jgi:hypothetical protein
MPQESQRNCQMVQCCAAAAARDFFYAIPGGDETKMYIGFGIQNICQGKSQETNVAFCASSTTSSFKGKKLHYTKLAK